MLAMQVNHSSLLPSFAPGFSPSFPSRAHPGNLPFLFLCLCPCRSRSILLSSPSRATLSFSSLSPSSRWKERRRRTYVASHTTQLFRSLSRSALSYDRLFLSHSVPYVVSSQSNFAFFQRPPYSIKKAKRDEAEFRAKEREDECKATNKFSGITLSARERARIECAWKQLAYRLGRPRPRDIFA